MAVTSSFSGVHPPVPGPSWLKIFGSAVSVEWEDSALVCVESIKLWVGPNYCMGGASLWYRRGLTMVRMESTKI